MIMWTRIGEEHKSSHMWFVVSHDNLYHEIETIFKSVWDDKVSAHCWCVEIQKLVRQNALCLIKHKHNHHISWEEFKQNYEKYGIIDIAEICDEILKKH